MKTDKIIEKKKSENPKKKSLKGLIFPLLALAAVIASGLILWITWHSSKQVERLQAEINHLKTSISKVGESQQTRLSQTENRVQSLQASLNEVILPEGNQKQKYLLTKARFYLELAGIQAYWTLDSQSTLALLHAADLVLAKSDDPAVMPVRQAISDEIQAIKSAAKPDLVGLLNQLNAIKTAVLTLPFKPLFSQKTVKPEKSANPLGDHFKESLQMLGKLVLIRKQDAVQVEKMSSPLYKSLVKENIMMQMEVAKWAVLEGLTEVYQQALDASIKNIQTLFDPRATQSLISDLQQLKSTPIKAEKTPPGEALVLVDKLIQSMEGKS